jgi:hypothetical protein
METELGNINISDLPLHFTKKMEGISYTVTATTSSSARYGALQFGANQQVG